MGCCGFWLEGNCGLPIACPIADIFIVPCVFRSTGWGISNLTLKELASALNLPQVNASELLVLASVSDGEVMSRLLALLPVKALQFSLGVTLRIGSSNGTKLKVEDKFGPLRPLYSLRYDNSFHHELNERRTKAVKDDDV